MTASSCFVTNPTGEVLLVRSLGRSWECPGGKLEPGETILDALHREVFEETGCRVRVDRLVGIYVNRTLGGLQIFLFRGTWLAGAPTPSDETPEVAWFAPDALDAVVPDGPQGMRLRDGLADRDRPVYREYTIDPFEVVRTVEL